MAQYIPKGPLVAEIERRRDLHYKYYMKNGACSIAECKYDEDREILSFLNTLEVKEADLENYNKVKKVLSLSFMHFLDANRPEGKMCLSNGECFDIEKAFDELDFSKLFRYMEKYLKAQKGE